MLRKEMETALNEQINEELFSAYLYYSMAAHFESTGLAGFASWMRNQAMEELAHAQKFFAYICERGAAVKLTAIEGPATTWASPLAAFKGAYDHEVHISGCINKLVDLALSQSDHATNNFLQWFVGEQVEEEASVDDIVQKLTLVGENKGGMFMLDNELGRRVFTPPVAE